jgi:hypothetical protein
VARCVRWDSVCQVSMWTGARPRADSLATRTDEEARGGRANGRGQSANRAGQRLCSAASQAPAPRVRRRQARPCFLSRLLPHLASALKRSHNILCGTLDKAVTPAHSSAPARGPVRPAGTSQLPAAEDRRRPVRAHRHALIPAHICSGSRHQGAMRVMPAVGGTHADSRCSGRHSCG